MKIFKASNDKYLPIFNVRYHYDSESGLITNRDGKVINSGRNGYIDLVKKVNGKRIRITAHRLIAYKQGWNLQGKHVDGVRDDNRLVNLRVCDVSTNRRNTSITNNNKSGVTGVCWHKYQHKWHVTICNKHIMYSGDFFEACCVRKSAELKLGGFTTRHGR